jgi:hypothetical protein
MSNNTLASSATVAISAINSEGSWGALYEPGLIMHGTHDTHLVGFRCGLQVFYKWTAPWHGRRSSALHRIGMVSVVGDELAQFFYKWTAPWHGRRSSALHRIGMVSVVGDELAQVTQVAGVAGLHRRV